MKNRNKRNRKSEGRKAERHETVIERIESWLLKMAEESFASYDKCGRFTNFID